MASATLLDATNMVPTRLLKNMKGKERERWLDQSEAEVLYPYSGSYIKKEETLVNFIFLYTKRRKQLVRLIQSVKGVRLVLTDSIVFCKRE